MEEAPGASPPSRLRGASLLIPGAIVIAGSIIAAAVLYVGLFGRAERGSAPTTLTPDTSQTAASGAVGGDIADDDPSLGSPDAPVTFVEFSDFQCPFCRKLFREVLPQLKEKYIKTGKVRFVYRDFPLPAIHDMAEKYAQAGECADEQGKFWLMHDKIFEEQERYGAGTIGAFSVSDVKRWAREIGLDGGVFEACLDSGKYADEVAKDYRHGQALGASGTPTVFINGRLVVGALPFAQFEALIEEALAKR